MYNLLFNNSSLKYRFWIMDHFQSGSMSRLIYDLTNTDDHSRSSSESESSSDESLSNELHIEDPNRNISNDVEMNDVEEIVTETNISVHPPGLPQNLVFSSFIFVEDDRNFDLDNNDRHGVFNIAPSNRNTTSLENSVHATLNHLQNRVSRVANSSNRTSAELPRLTRPQPRNPFAPRPRPRPRRISRFVLDSNSFIQQLLNASLRDELPIRGVGEPKDIIKNYPGDAVNGKDTSFRYQKNEFKDECVACLDKISDIKYETCGHVVYCLDCEKKALKSTNEHACPLCRQISPKSRYIRPKQRKKRPKTTSSKSEKNSKRSKTE